MTTPKTDASRKTPSFEEALARLEEIVEQLDDGNLPLAQSLELFKEGTTLAQQCRTYLTQAELAVKTALADVQSDEKEESQFDDGSNDAAVDRGAF